VLGPLWVWLAVDERPTTATLVGGAIVVVGVVIQAAGGSPRASRPAPAPVR
jgi:drug/metabolite transporter (DMT)-like permease